MIRPFAVLTLSLSALALVSCSDQESEGPAVPPTTAETLEVPEDLIMPPEEAEVPPAVGQEAAAIPDTPPVLPEGGPAPSPAASPPPEG
ncbi:hypothetical protein IWC96_03910 [Brevundimonas sp. BAL450]|jgi:type IV secretory pathway VirB10-like protein|uniref:hypothetical protein n=1 Tax=Brevundimonas sp. BAL450 TaxID=1708162 RepID=UPI0018CB4266|nr:hypothetical protein [Brevundimonas sp. BAL450]MBG7614428.1 hypothetical protein [Brevundimonas sp. BAL450]